MLQKLFVILGCCRTVISMVTRTSHPSSDPATFTCISYSTCALIHQWRRLPLGCACPNGVKTTAMHSLLEPPNLSLKNYRGFRTVLPDWWHVYTLRQEELCTPSLSCSDSTGLLYASKFSTKFAYLFTIACMMWVLPTCQNCYSTTSGTAASVHLLQRSSDDTSPEGKVGRVSFGVAGPQV